MLNPMKLMKMKDSWETFTRNHPQFPAFLQAVYPNGVQAGTVLEIGVTPPDGKPLRYRMTVTQEDMELFAGLSELTK